MEAPDPGQVARAIKEAARAEGFDLVGVAAATVLDAGPLDRWLANGWDAGLWYVRDSRDERLDPARVLPGAKSVISVAISYRQADPVPPAEPHGVVARYARGRDYHNVMRRPLRRLRDVAEKLVPGSTAYASCDSRPVMEKAWAQRAGLGWIGKNGCFISPALGSYLLLGCVITTAEIAPDSSHADRCGTCVACLSSCPTDAIPEPRYVDARKCLSFHTIEHQDAIPPEIRPKMAGRLFGCDLCQEVCPWNRGDGAAPGRLGLAMQPRENQAFVPLSALLKSSREEVEARIAGTPLARAGYDGLVRTAKALAGEDS